MAKKCCVLILVATLLAAALRLPGLEQRPMHGDEAVQADKFGSLLERNFYRYDPDEHHGPTLYYLSLVPAWFGSAQKLSDISEFTLRIVPVFAGLLLLLLLLLLVDGLGPTAAVLAAVLTAVSPAFVFYSRYYIQEMLLVCFTFGVITSGYRYIRSKNIKWALLTGIFLGLTHATKETCIIAFASMLLAILLTLLMQRRQDALFSSRLKAIKPLHVFAALVVAAIVSALFYSSFFTNPRGILDSVLAYKNYFNRVGQNQLHIHPWYYYLKMLIYSRYASGPVWSEAVIVILAVAGFIIAITKKGLAGANSHLLRFIAFYTAFSTLLYALIRYKTPWCMLGFLHGMILLAAVGALAIIRWRPGVVARTVICLLLGAAAGHLTWQAYLGSYKFYADTRNPYVYAHPTTDVFTIARRIEDIAQVHPDGRNMRIQVICPEYDYWPLPWYFRSFPNAGFWNDVEDNVLPAPVIIASPSVEPALVKRLYELPAPGQQSLYVPLFDRYIQLRPQVELRGFVIKDLWDSYQQHKAQ